MSGIEYDDGIEVLDVPQNSEEGEVGESSHVESVEKASSELGEVDSLSGEINEEDISAVHEGERFTDKRYWETPNDAIDNREEVWEYAEKREELGQQMRATVAAIYESHGETIETLPTLRRFKDTASKEDFELYGENAWRHKLGGDCEGVLGYHNFVNNSIGLRDGKCHKEAITHETIHAMSFWERSEVEGTDGQTNEIVQSGVRRYNMDTNEDIGVGLNEGLTQMYTKEALIRINDVSETGEVELSNAYHTETTWAEQLRSLAGERACDRAYFCGDDSELREFVDAHSGQGWEGFLKSIDQYQEMKFNSEYSQQEVEYTEQRINSSIHEMWYAKWKEEQYEYAAGRSK